MLMLNIYVISMYHPFTNESLFLSTQESSQGTEIGETIQWQLDPNHQQDIVKYLRTLPPQVRNTLYSINSNEIFIYGGCVFLSPFFNFILW